MQSALGVGKAEKIEEEREIRKKDKTKTTGRGGKGKLTTKQKRKNTKQQQKEKPGMVFFYLASKFLIEAVHPHSQIITKILHLNSKVTSLRRLIIAFCISKIFLIQLKMQTGGE